MIAQIETALNVVDKASQSSDRWLFLGLLVVVLTGGVVVIKYLVNSGTAKDAEHARERMARDAESKGEREQARADNRAERDAAKAERKADQVEFLRVIEALKAEIKLLIDATMKNTATLERHDADMRTAHALEIGALVKHELQRLGVEISELPFKTHGGK